MQIRIRAVVVMALVGALAMSACGGDSKKKSGPKSTTTTAKAIPIAPLTGLEDPTGAALTRCALTVKIENDALARPQAGIADADVVYEQVIDGGIVRLAAIFNQAIPKAVGPIRSVRPIDPKIVYPIGGVFAYSGGVPENVTAIESVPGLTTLNETSAGNAMYRIKERQPPRNLYGDPGAMLQKCPKQQGPASLFQFRGPKDPAPVGDPVQSVDVQVSPDKSMSSAYAWDGSQWVRSQNGKAFVDRDGNQVKAANMIVMFLVWNAPVGSFNAEGNMIGSGDALIFTNGVQIKGKWSRPALEKPATYTDANGAPVLLTPGKTWVELAPTGQPVNVTAPPTTTTAVPPSTTAPAAPATTAKKR